MSLLQSTTARLHEVKFWHAAALAQPQRFAVTSPLRGGMSGESFSHSSIFDNNVYLDVHHFPIAVRSDMSTYRRPLAISPIWSGELFHSPPHPSGCAWQL